MNRSFRIEVSPRNSEYIRITTSDEARFDAAIRELLPANVAEVAFVLKPYLFVVSNPSSRNVVAYCVRFDFVNGNRLVHRQFDHCKNPTAVLTDVSVRSNYNEPLRPTDRRVISTGAIFPLRPEHNNPHWIPDYRDHLHEMHPPGSITQLNIEVDAVILDDGTLIGRNENDFGTAFSISVSTEREIFRDIVEGVDAGKPLGEIFELLLSESQRLARDPDKAFELLRFEKVQSAGEAYRIWKRIGDEDFLRIARGSLRRVPFVLKPHQ